VLQNLNINLKTWCGNEKITPYFYGKVVKISL